MTKKQAYQVDILTSTGVNTRIVIDKIFDYFESRKCEICTILETWQEQIFVIIFIVRKSNENNI